MKKASNTLFLFELASDGNLDLYIEKPTDFTRDQVETLVDRGWLNTSVLTDLEGDVGLDPFSQDDYLNQSERFFQFVLEKTFGTASNVAGVEELDEYVILNIEIPT